MRKGKKFLIILCAILISVITVVTLASCINEKTETMSLLNLAEVDNLETIQENGELTFEWLKNYNKKKPTMILFHGETTSLDKFSMSLDTDEYTFYDSENNPTDYVIDTDSDGYQNSKFNTDLSYYWLNVAEYNVAIFHWESFAYDYTSAISSKLFTVPKMRYRKEDDTFEVNKVPKVALAELVTNLYINEMIDKDIQNEIRFVGNGIGSNLALSVTNLLDVYNQNKLIDSKVIPNRLALNDPYLTSENMYLSINWNENIDTTSGTLGMYNDMLSEVTDNGTVVEMIEAVCAVPEVKNVVDENGEESELVVYTNDYSYPSDRSTAKTKELFDDLTSKLAYLKMSQNYSKQFSESYLDCHRVALDWYLASIMGSDDNSIGYNIGSTSSNNNGGNKSTRPILNDRYANDDVSSAVASKRGKNYGVSAWTPTVYTRALRGIKFSLKERTTNAQSDVHENMRYNYKDYVMEYFRTENYQKSDQTDYTLLCGYIYVDSNDDGYINDDATNGLNEETVKLVLKEKTGDVIAKFDFKTSKDGFYTIRLNDKVEDENGDLSEEGYAFDSSGVNVELYYYITSTKYVYQKATSDGIYYDKVAGQHFSTEKCTFVLNNDLADSITIKNCLLKPEIIEE